MLFSHSRASNKNWAADSSRVYSPGKKKCQMWQFHIPKLKTDALTLTQVIHLNSWLLTILHENLVYHFLKLLSKEMSLERQI